MTAASTSDSPPEHLKARAALTLSALGVVFGDIGTSPLYTMKAMLGQGPARVTDLPDPLGAASAIFWLLFLVVTLKYVVLVLRADYRGEGGILALAALASRAVIGRPGWRPIVLMIGVVGAALFYGDSIITPAISVLGAIEGVEVVAPGFERWLVPLSIAVVAVLFWVQRVGTGAVGRAFGPLMLVWFGTLAVSGIAQIVQTPAVLLALNPLRGVHFLTGPDGLRMLLLGSVVLAVTGAEALYVDMGHFGRSAIRRAWLWLVFPALALNYLGQGALLMRDPDAIVNPFFHLFPDALQLPAIVLATVASVIASQAVISGAFSLTQQAIQLGLVPRLRILHTSASASGQIYIPAVNVLLFIAVVLAIVGFRGSSALAGAYGIAVSGTMLCTTMLIVVVAQRMWRLSLPLLALCVLPFLLLDGTLVAACALKFFDGGWFPMAVGAVLLLGMTTWRRGRQLMRSAGPATPLLQPQLTRLEIDKTLHRPDRTAVFLTADPANTPRALLHNMAHNQVLHRSNILLSVLYEDEPRVPAEKRISCTRVSESFWQVSFRCGFMEQPNVPAILWECVARGIEMSPAEVSYFLSREIVVPTPGIGMALWREHLFAWLSRNAESNVGYFQLPDEQVIVLSARIPI